MLRAEGLPRQTALLKLNNQPRCLNPAPATPHYNPSRFTHATSPPQQQYPEKVWLLLRVRFIVRVRERYRGTDPTIPTGRPPPAWGDDGTSQVDLEERLGIKQSHLSKLLTKLQRWDLIS